MTDKRQSRRCVVIIKYAPRTVYQGPHSSTTWVPCFAHPGGCPKVTAQHLLVQGLWPPVPIFHGEGGCIALAASNQVRQCTLRLQF